MSVRSEAVQVVIFQLHLLQIHTRPVANIYDVTYCAFRSKLGSATSSTKPCRVIHLSITQFSV